MRAQLSGWVGSFSVALLGALLGSLATPVHAQLNADLEYGTYSQKDPHPVTYVWNGEVTPVTDPGPNFYYFYYTGTVDDGARVPADEEIKRVPVSLNEWAANKRYLVSKLTLFYQLTRNMQPSALSDLTGEAPATPATDQSQQLGAPGATTPGAVPYGAAPYGAAPGAIQDPNQYPGGLPPAAATLNDPNSIGNIAPQGSYYGEGGGLQAVPTPPPMPTPAVGFGGGPPGLFPGGGGYGGIGGLGGFGGGFGGGGQNFDARAAAEWTFYYDQYVLWQYYCGRVLLRDKEDKLIEGEGSPSSTDETGGTGSTQGRPGSGTNRLLEQAAKAGPISAGDSTADLIANRPGATGGVAGGPGGGFIDQYSGGFYSQQANLAQPGLPGQDSKTPLREVFMPMLDYDKPNRQLEYRDKFRDAANLVELDLYKSFVEMINRIDEREVNQEQYEEWLQTKRQEIFNFAESWRKLEAGETQLIDGTMFLVTDEPLESVPYDAINVTRREQLTPQDLLNEDGSLKRPVVQ